tara:strand:- start:6832 stop:7191 length:360 start_codon:yes stop_codon:yes gene_type:complete
MWEKILKQDKLTTECRVMSKDSEKYKDQDGQKCFVTWSLDIDRSSETIAMALEVHKVEFKDGFEPFEFTGLGEGYLIQIRGADFQNVKNGFLGDLEPESVYIDSEELDNEPLITFEFYK